MKPNYGIDAPYVIRNLFLSALAMAIVTSLSFLIEDRFWFWVVFLYLSLTSLALLFTSGWMLYGVKVAKPKLAAQIIKNLNLSGHEKVLDLGCGRGLLLCKLARYLPHGEAHGIDLWSKKDQSGNSFANTLENAEREGVKILLHTGDVRSLPFPDSSFDVAVSSLCFHNIKEREKALLEMLRILKPGGKFAIADISYSREYADFLAQQGARVNCSKPYYAYCPPITIVEGID